VDSVTKAADSSNVIITVGRMGRGQAGYGPRERLPREVRVAGSGRIPSVLGSSYVNCPCNL